MTSSAEGEKRQEGEREREKRQEQQKMNSKGQEGYWLIPIAKEESIDGARVLEEQHLAGCMRPRD